MQNLKSERIRLTDDRKARSCTAPCPSRAGQRFKITWGGDGACGEACDGVWAWAWEDKRGEPPSSSGRDAACGPVSYGDQVEEAI